MILYVSGPMSGLPEFNYPAFQAAQEALEDAGYDVLSPHENKLDGDATWIDYMLVDIDDLFEAEGVALLDGCETSNGSRIECRIAANLGLDIKPLQWWLENRT